MATPARSDRSAAQHLPRPFDGNRAEPAGSGAAITYMVGGQQYVAFVAGTNSPIWPVDKKTAKVVVYGLAP